MNNLKIKIKTKIFYILNRTAFAGFCFAVLLLMFSAGCNNYANSNPAMSYYYLNPDKNLSALGRVAIVELDNNSSYPQISSDVTDAIFRALQKKQVFGLAIVRQNNPAWRSLQLGPDTTYTLEQLMAIRKTLNCDAVLIGSITEFNPYPPMTIGLRLKLIDLKDGQLVWGIEQVWDIADKTTENRIKNYFKKQMNSDFVPLRQQLMAVSPLKFFRFVAQETAETFR
ncbi:MAG: hypothetical protein KAI59_06565 [Planctomycetes bacterium]|nr:hypothetical protein [Planctomycetota bacterium]MCK5473679.1 hypothetical protein [Planctomycetota bacterium]